MPEEPRSINDISGQVLGPVVQARHIGQVQITQHPRTPIIPAQLPAAPIFFVGRERELKQLGAVLSVDAERINTLVISTIGGSGGIGKTALALHWAHIMHDRFPDGQLYVNLRGFDHSSEPVKPSEALRGFLSALGVDPPQIPVDLQERAALYRSILATKRLLILLDNALDSQQVRPLLPGGATCAVLVTSRNQLDDLISDGANFLTLGYLKNDDAQELLAARLGKIRIDAELEAVAELISYCAGLPLALCVVAARAATQPTFPIAAVTEELRTERNRLIILSMGERATNLRSVFSWSYQALPEPARRLFRMLGLSRGPDIGLNAVASLTKESVHQTRELLRELTRAHLLEEHSPRRYRLHDLLRLYAMSLLEEVDAEAERHEAVERMLEYYLHAAATASSLLIGNNPLVNSHVHPIDSRSTISDTVLGLPTNKSDALAWFESEDSCLLAAVAQAKEFHLHHYSYQLPLAVDNVWVWRGRLQDVSSIWRITVDIASRQGNLKTLLYANRFLGLASMRTGNNDEARVYLERSVALSAEQGDTLNQAAAQLNLATACGRQGDNGAAFEHAIQALHLFRVNSSASGEAHALNALGGFQAQAGEYEEALLKCQRAVEIFRQLGDQDGEADALDGLGNVHHWIGDYVKAEDAYRHAIALYWDVGDVFGRADALSHLGDTLFALSAMSSAREIWRQAVELFVKQGRLRKAQEVQVKLGGHVST